LSIQFGIIGNRYNVISSLCRDPQARMVLNDLPTDYVKCLIGAKQGDCLSPTLFSIFVNDLSVALIESEVGIKIEDDQPMESHQISNKITIFYMQMI
jgi:hypothetical protein